MHTLIAIAMNEHYEWAPIIRAFNEQHQKDANPLTVEILQEHPKGSIGKDGWFSSTAFSRKMGSGFSRRIAATA